MNNFGWGIRPAGWLLLFLVIALLIFYTVSWLQRPSDKNQQEA